MGWGRKETQFYGSLGKYVNQKREEISPSLSEEDDRLPRVSWRGDGQFFVSSSINEKGDKRVLRIYDRECVLQSTSEEVSKLEHPLCWRPSGNLITSTQRLPQRHEVVFFEKNGLRHGEFVLREECRVLEVSWNSDSSVLSLFLEKQSGAFAVQLWTVNNYYYYLKQELTFIKGAEPTSVVWDPERPLSLHLILQNGHYRNYEFSWEVFSSSSLSSESSATVAVADGTNLLLTPFRFMNVPPPLSAFKIALPSTVSHLSFSPAPEMPNHFVALTSDFFAHFFGPNEKAPKGRPSLPVLYSSVKLGTNGGTIIRQLAWVSPAFLCYLETGNDVDPRKEVLVGVSLSAVPAPGAKEITVTENFRVDCRTQMLRLSWNVNDASLTLQSIRGEVFKVDLSGQLNLSSPWVVLPSPCQWMATVNTQKKDVRTPAALASSTERDDSGDEFYGDEPATPELAVIALNYRGKLSINGRVLASNCNSFHVHSDFLIVSTFSHTCRFVLLSELLTTQINEDPAGESLEAVRIVERGSSIVISVPHDVSLVLQMPRGNLETVCPRALVLATVRDALDDLDFKKALLLARKHRIDMNVLCDHNPERFDENLGAFLAQIDDTDNLNLFLSGLKFVAPSVHTFRSSSHAFSPPLPPQKKIPETKMLTRPCTAE